MHVRTPSAQEITCRPASTGGFGCHAGIAGQTYSRIDAIRRPIGSAFSRGHISAWITTQLAAGKMTSAVAARFRTDLARVPDSFFREMQLASRFGTYGGGYDGRVPPVGVPKFLVCENAGSSLSCQDLNGDNAAPIGAGVYLALPSSNWRPAAPHRGNTSLPPGITFTPAEYRVLTDLIRTATITHSSSGGHSGAPRTAPTRPRHQ